MAESDERQRIREQKRKELLERHGEGSPGDEESGGSDEPVDVRGREHLDELLEESPVLVDCYADWCGPCRMMEPAIERVAAETPAVVAKVDIDANQGLARQLGAQSVPTLLLFVDGQPVERLVGAQEFATLERVVREHS